MKSELREIALDLVDPDPLNPQVQDLATFNELVENVKANGMLESITVVEAGDRFLLVAGEHRWKAALLAGLTHGPAIVLDSEQWSIDERRIQLVKMNVLKGKLDGAKFIDLYQDLLKRIPDPNELKRRMGFDAKDAELHRLIKQTSDALPEQMQKELARRKETIRSVEDLSSTVKSLFARYGASLEASFVVFSFLGQTHLMVRCTPETFAPIQALAERTAESEGKFDEVLSDLASSAL
jgi:ParB/RepB/Spo0J family partition protein